MGKPVEPGGQVPAAAVEEAERGGQDDDADEGGVEQQGDGDPEAHLLEHDQLSSGEPLNTTMMIRAAPVMIRAVEATPPATASLVEPVW